jgi:hypothetical protein
MEIYDCTDSLFLEHFAGLMATQDELKSSAIL